VVIVLCCLCWTVHASEPVDSGAVAPSPQVTAIAADSSAQPTSRDTVRIVTPAQDTVIKSQVSTPPLGVMETPIPADTAHTATRPRQPQNLDTMVVRSRPFERLGPSSISLDAADLRGKYLDLGSVLENVAGVTVQRVGGVGEYAAVSIRGSSTQQVEVLLDGVPMNSAVGGAADIGKVPLGAVQNVAVHREIAPLEYFAMNAGGVIQISTVPTRDISQGSCEFGSFGYHKAGLLARRSIGITSHSLVFDYASAKNNYPYYFDDSPYNRGDEVIANKPNNDFFSTSATYGGTVHLNTDNMMRLTGSYSQFEEGLFAYQDPRAPASARLRGRTANGSLRYEATPGTRWSAVVQAAGRFKTQRLIDQGGSFYLGGDKDYEERFPYASGLATLSRQVGSFISATAIVAADYERYGIENFLNKSGLPSPGARRSQGLAGFELSARTDALQAGVEFVERMQRDYNEGYYLFGVFYGGKPLAWESLPAGQIHVQWRANPQLAVTAAGKWVKRSPNFTEKFGLFGNYAGNPALKPETRVEASLGASVKLRLVESSLSVYIGQTRDQIVALMQSQRVFVPRNYDAIVHAGAEWDAAVTPWKWLNLSNSLTLCTNRISQAADASLVGNQEALQPQFIDCVRATGSLHGFSLGHSLLVRSRYYLSMANTQRSDQEDPVAGAYAAYTFRQHAAVTFRVDNYLNVINDDFFGSPLPGRAFYLICSLSL